MGRLADRERGTPHAETLFDGLTSGWCLAFALIAVVAVLATVLLLSRGIVRGTRLTAIANALRVGDHLLERLR